MKTVILISAITMLTSCQHDVDDPYADVIDDEDALLYCRTEVDTDSSLDPFVAAVLLGGPCYDVAAEFWQCAYENDCNAFHCDKSSVYRCTDALQR